MIDILCANIFEANVTDNGNNGGLWFERLAYPHRSHKASSHRLVITLQTIHMNKPTLSHIEHVECVQFNLPISAGLYSRLRRGCVQLPNVGEGGRLLYWGSLVFDTKGRLAFTKVMGWQLNNQQARHWFNLGTKTGTETVNAESLLCWCTHSRWVEGACVAVRSVWTRCKLVSQLLRVFSHKQSTRWERV